MIEKPSEENAFHARHIELLLDSLEQLTGKSPVPRLDDTATAKVVWEAPFALVSHGVEDDPIFNYGNLKALELFEMNWESFTKLPSRLSAEAANRAEREVLLEKVNQDGFINDYSGVRISATGRRFHIENVLIWNISDKEEEPCGQAALFSDWGYLDG